MIQAAMASGLVPLPSHKTALLAVAIAALAPTTVPGREQGSTSQSASSTVVSPPI